MDEVDLKINAGLAINQILLKEVDDPVVDFRLKAELDRNNSFIIDNIAITMGREKVTFNRTASLDENGIMALRLT